MSDVIISGIDTNGKSTSMRVPVIDAPTGPQVQALIDALDAVSRATGLKGVQVVETEIDGGDQTPPNDADAVRTTKWIFRTQTTNGNGQSVVLTNELGIADLSQLPSPGSAGWDLSAGVGLALKTAWEAIYESNYGNSGTLLAVDKVFRGE